MSQHLEESKTKTEENEILSTTKTTVRNEQSRSTAIYPRDRRPSGMATDANRGTL